MSNFGDEELEQPNEPRDAGDIADIIFDGIEFWADAEREERQQGRGEGPGDIIHWRWSEHNSIAVQTRDGRAFKVEVTQLDAWPFSE